MTARKRAPRVMLTALVAGLALNGVAIAQETANQGELARTLETADLSPEAKERARRQSAFGIRSEITEDGVFYPEDGFVDPTDVMKALRRAIADGTIDCVATDHAPHPPEDKEREFDLAPCGMLNLETALGVLVTELVDQGVIDWVRLVEVMSIAPARARNLSGHGGPIAPGAQANLVAFDPTATWVVEPERLASKSRNTPFAGRTLKGRVVHTMLRGRFTVREGSDADGQR